MLVDWRASIIAGLVAGTIFLILNMLLIPAALDGSVEMLVRYIASILLGEQAVNPGYEYGTMTLLIAVALHYLLSILFAMLVALVVHRGGILLGLLGGTLLGGAIYLINMYAVTQIFYWFFTLESTLFLLLHLLFGAVTGALYESLERTPYEQAQGEHSPT